MSLATLTAVACTKSYGAHLVLDAISLVVAPGDRIGVVGPNGAGKSTLLRLLAGHEHPDAGDVRRDPPSASVGLLRQQMDLVAGERVGEYLARVTGVASASAVLDLAATAIASGEPGADDRYVAALDRYVALSAGDFEARVAAVLDDVGLDPSILALPTAALSGGQAARCALAGILSSRFDVLLLDEPTNDLDFDGLARLDAFLDDIAVGVVVVSHDRAFLERSIRSVVEIDAHAHTVARFEGGWQAYRTEQARARALTERQYDEYVDKRAGLSARAQRERSWSAKGKGAAKRRAEPDKYVRERAKQQSEQLAARARRTERMIDRLEVVDKPWEGWELRLDLVETRRSGDVVVVLRDAVARRGGFELGPIDLDVRFGERIAIVGRNGSGKSTLLRVVLGEHPLAAGDREVGPSVVFGTIDQGRDLLGSDDELGAAFATASELPIPQARSLLAKFGLGADHVTRTVGSLSPGERTRAVLALLMAKGANCLVLDEPTNHLDLPAIEQLESALRTWSGTLLVVTHDRVFLDALAIDRTIEVARS